MPSPDQLRDFIPYGNCVSTPGLESPPQAVEAFAALDAGRIEIDSLTTAKAACNQCVQKPNCLDQQVAIADELWSRGVTTTVVGGAVKKGAPKNPILGLHEPTFRFDITHLPANPERRLNLLRQAVRAGQLSLSFHPPAHLPELIWRNANYATEQDAGFMQKYMSKITPPVQERSWRYIVGILCQQADYANTDNPPPSNLRGRKNARYDPERFDYQGNHEVIRTYFEAVIATTDLRCRNPAQAALYHTPGFYRAVLDTYAGRLPPSDIHEFIRKTVVDPVAAINAYLARATSQRAQGNAPDHVARRRAMPKSPPSPDKTKEEITNLQTDYPELNATTAEFIGTYHADHEQAAEDYAARVDRLEAIYGTSHPVVTPGLIRRFARSPFHFEENADEYLRRLNTIQARHGDDLDFTPSMLRILARTAKSTEIMLDEVIAIKQRREMWRRWMARDPSLALSESLLQRLSTRKDIESPADLQRAHILYVLKQRAEHRRVKNPDGNQRPQHWMFERLGALYPVSELNKAGEGLLALLYNNVLTPEIVEDVDRLRGVSLPIDFRSVCDARSGRHVTFNGHLRTLSPSERVALAHVFGVSQLIYGRTFSERQIAQDRPVKDLEQYVHETILPKCEALLATSDAQTPLSFSDLCRDVADANMRITIRTRNEPPIFVIGGKAVYDVVSTQSPSVHVSPLDAEVQSWLVRAISSACPPSEQKRCYHAVETAILSGAFQVAGEMGTNPHLALHASFENDQLSDLDRIVIFHLSGADSLVYGSNMKRYLENRLQTSATDYAMQHILPKLGAWKSAEDILAEANCTPQALKILLAKSGVTKYQIWHMGSDITCISAKLANSILGKQFLPPPNDWVSHQTVAALPNASKYLSQISSNQYRLSRPDGGLLDVYYNLANASRL